MRFGAWLSATFSPIFLCALFKRRAKQAEQRWILHVLFAPIVLLVVWVSAFLLTLTDGDQARAADEGEMGLLLLPAMVILLWIMVIYYASLAFGALRRLRRSRGNGS